MKCPECHSATRVLETREIRLGARRRRECRKCGHRFSTYELPAGGLVARLAELPADAAAALLEETEGRQP